MVRKKICIPRKLIFKFCLLLVVIWMVICICALGYRAIRNYSGYCKVNGVKLSNDKRLDIAIQKYLKEQYRDFHEIGIFEKTKNSFKIEYPSREDLMKRFELISYKSKKDFLEINPDCCELKWWFAERDSFDFWMRATGAGNGSFDFKHKVRYKQKNGEIKEIISRNISIEVDNCGYAKIKSYY